MKDKKTKRLSPNSDDEARRLRRFMCDNFFDIRTFGGVLSTGINAGQVRGPVQFAFARSVEPILPLENLHHPHGGHQRGRAEAAAGGRGRERREARRQPHHGAQAHRAYGLYRAHGFVSAPLASDERKGTGFSEADLDLLWEAIDHMFEHDRSAARGEMAKRKLVIFRHASALGNAPAHDLFERVKTWRVHKGSRHAIGDDATDNWPPARAFSDYAITVEGDGLPAGVEIVER